MNEQSKVKEYKTIALLDSGVGGFSILSVLKKNIPNHKYVYFYDNDFAPYGTKSIEQIIDRCDQVCNYLIQNHNPDFIVLACNTASTLALDFLRKKYKTEFIGVVPAIKPAALLTQKDKIALLATPKTIVGEYVDALMNTFGRGKQLIKVASPELVQKVEDHYHGIRVDWNDLKTSLNALNDKSLDTVVLGCTHFPLVKEQLAVLFPHILNWVDSSEAINSRILSLLTKNALRSLEPRIDITDDKIDSICIFSRHVNLAHFKKTLKTLALRPITANIL